MAKLNLLIELHALAQAGITYSNSQFDTERYQRILQIAAELTSIDSSHNYAEILEQFIKNNGYITPKVDVRGAVFKDEQILLVREASDGLWSLPGGWADLNYSSAENILKEIREEAGFNCRVTKLIGVFDKSRDNFTEKWPHVYKIFFLCALQDDNTSPLSHEIMETSFFAWDKLPPLSTGRVSKAQIEKCFEHYKNPNVPSYWE